MSPVEPYKSLTNQVTGLRDSSRGSLAPSLIEVRVQAVIGVVSIIGIAMGRWGVDFKELSTLVLHTG